MNSIEDLQLELKEFACSVDYVASIYPSRTQDDDCFDASRHTIIDKPYKYWHIPLSDILMWEGLGLRELSSYALFQCTRKLQIEGKGFGDQVKLGDIVVRLIEYSDNKPFGGHRDVDLITCSIGSFDDGRNAELSMSTHWGEQAEMLGIAKSNIHKFNPNKRKYSLLLFVNAHYSLKLNREETGYSSIGNYLIHNCY